MKREVEREKKLPAFSITVGELEALWKRVLPLFENQDDIYGSVDITLAKEKLEFKSVEELIQFKDLKGKVTNFSLLLSKSGRRVSVRSTSLFYGPAPVRASAENESWCAGAIETIHSFIESHKVWYNWVVSAPFGWILFLFANLPLVGMLTLPKGTITWTMFIGWLTTLVTLIFLYLYRRKLFPAGVLRITDEETFIRRHSAELGLIIALLSAALTVVGLFLKR